MLVTGDSLVQPLDDLMVRPVERAGGRAIRDPRPGTGLTTPLVLDWVKHARHQVRKHRPHATVVFIGAGDTEPLTTAGGPRVACCQRAWIDAYADRVEQMMRTYMRRKRRPRVLAHAADAAPGRAAASSSSRSTTRSPRPRARRASKAHVVDTVPALSPGNRFQRKLRYRGESVVVRDGDGVHLTTDGARIARDLVVRAMRSDGVLRRTAQAAATAGTATLDYEKPLPELEIGAAYALAVEAGRAAVQPHRGRRGRRRLHRHRQRRAARPGPGACAVTARTVRCPTPRAAEDRSVFVDAARRRRPLALPGLRAGTLAEVRGGGGADLIFGSAGNDLLLGGAAATACRAARASTCSTAGAGDDVVCRRPRARRGLLPAPAQPVTVDLAEGTGGGRGERDRLFDIEGVIGSSAADDIRGTQAADTLVGGEGAAHDRLVGAPATTG